MEGVTIPAQPRRDIPRWRFSSLASGRSLRAKYYCLCSQTGVVMGADCDSTVAVANTGNARPYEDGVQLGRYTTRLARRITITLEQYSDFAAGVRIRGREQGLCQRERSILRPAGPFDIR